MENRLSHFVTKISQLIISMHNNLIKQHKMLLLFYHKIITFGNNNYAKAQNYHR